MSSVVGLDIGEGSTRLVEGRLKKGAFEILRAQSFPTSQLAAKYREGKLKGRGTIIGVTGRDMILRITQVPTVPAWQLRDLMALEIEDIAEQSGDELSADFGLLAAAGDDEDRVLLALVRNSLIAERTEAMAAAGGKLLAFTPNAIALHNAVVATDGGDGTLLVAALGGRNTDIALMRDGELLFARNLAGGGDLFTDAIADAFRLDFEKAEKAKLSLGVFPAPGETLAGQQGAVARVLEAPLRQVVGMLQSSMVLARSQLKLPDLEVERVLLCGPGASLPGFDKALMASLGLPVTRFDPTNGYLVGTESVPAARGPDFAVAAGLALMGVLPAAYRVAILPDALRKRQHFRARTLWLLLAAALVLGHLVLAFVTARDNTAAAATDLGRLRREVESRKADVSGHARVVAETQELAAKLSTLEDLTAPGSGALTAMGVLEANLPAELWVTGLKSTRGIEPQLGHGGVRRPFIAVDGHGKEQSRNLSDAVTELTTRLRGQPGISTVLPRVTTDSRGTFNFSLTLDTSVVPGKPGEAGEAGADDAATDEAPADAPVRGSGG